MAASAKGYFCHGKSLCGLSAEPCSSIGDAVKRFTQSVVVRSGGDFSLFDNNDARSAILSQILVSIFANFYWFRNRSALSIYKKETFGKIESLLWILAIWWYCELEAGNFRPERINDRQNFCFKKAFKNKKTTFRSHPIPEMTMAQQNLKADWRRKVKKLDFFYKNILRIAQEQSPTLRRTRPVRMRVHVTVLQSADLQQKEHRRAK